MLLTRYLLVVVLHQLIESTHMTIRDLVEHQIKVEDFGTRQFDRYDMAEPSNSEGFNTSYGSYNPYQSYGDDTDSGTNIPYYHPQIIQQDLLPAIMT